MDAAIKRVAVPNPVYTVPVKPVGNNFDALLAAYVSHHGGIADDRRVLLRSTHDRPLIDSDTAFVLPRPLDLPAVADNCAGIAYPVRPRNVVLMSFNDHRGFRCTRRP